MTVKGSWQDNEEQQGYCPQEGHYPVFIQFVPNAPSREITTDFKVFTLNVKFGVVRHEYTYIHVRICVVSIGPTVTEVYFSKTLKILVHLNYNN